MPNSPRLLRSRFLSIALSSSILGMPIVDSSETLNRSLLALPHPLSPTSDILVAQDQDDPLPPWGVPGGSRWGVPGGSRGHSDVPPDLNWGEPGGSRLISDMADDLVDFYQWGDPGGSRSGLLCPITPDSPRVESSHGGNFDVWSDRPLIVWHSGDVRRIVIRDYDTNAVVWNQPVEPTNTQVRYDGDPLEPGKLYVLIFVGPSPDEFLFNTLTEDKRAVVSTELAQLETEARDNGASEEQVALWRSRFFIQHEHRLLYDGLEAIFAVEEPSPELRERQEALVSSLCHLNTNE